MKAFSTKIRRIIFNLAGIALVFLYSNNVFAQSVTFIQNTPPDDPTISAGPGIGNYIVLPVALIACLVLAILLYRCKRKGKQTNNLPENHESVN